MKEFWKGRETHKVTSSNQDCCFLQASFSFFFFLHIGKTVWFSSMWLHADIISCVSAGHISGKQFYTKNQKDNIRLNVK